ncbi:MAG: hypothetical protein R3236_01870 [Phycisphaeraceae bacterium]|nr:hypothetical protein [Phycisphaeraceae bacterium]
MNLPTAKRPEDLTIRPAVEKDVPAVHQLIVDLSVYEERRHERVATPTSLYRIPAMNRPTYV